MCIVFVWCALDYCQKYFGVISLECQNWNISVINEGELEKTLHQEQIDGSVGFIMITVPIRTLGSKLMNNTSALELSWE